MSENSSTSDAQVHSAAMGLTSSFMTEQWMGSHVYKVGNTDRFKMFAILSPGQAKLTLKTDSPDVAELLIQAGVAERNAHLPRAGWVTLKLDCLSPDDVNERLTTSHALVAATLPKLSRKKFGLD
ncbi:MAG: MmcQ/YjbR family DNA-binding protein [Litorimonas sp.]